jgi:hypothetical protein
MYMIIRNVNEAMIIVNGKLLFVCKLLVAGECFCSLSKYISKLRIASGIISKRAIDRNKVPENVMAILIIEPYLKHFIPEMNFPNSMTSLKKTSIRTIFIIVAASIYLNYYLFYSNK